MVRTLYPEPGWNAVEDEYDLKRLHTLLPEAVVRDAQATSHRAEHKIQTDDGHAPGLTYFITPSSVRDPRGQDYGRCTKFCGVLAQYSRLHCSKLNRTASASVMTWAFSNVHDEEPVRITSEFDLAEFAVSRHEAVLGCQLSSAVCDSWAPVILLIDAQAMPRKRTSSFIRMSFPVESPALSLSSAFPFSSRVFPGPPWLVPVDHPTCDSVCDGGSGWGESVVATSVELPAEPVILFLGSAELPAEPVMPPAKPRLPPRLPSTFSLFPPVPITFPTMQDRDAWASFCQLIRIDSSRHTDSDEQSVAIPGVDLALYTPMECSAAYQILAWQLTHHAGDSLPHAGGLPAIHGRAALLFFLLRALVLANYDSVQSCRSMSGEQQHLSAHQETAGVCPCQSDKAAIQCYAMASSITREIVEAGMSRVEAGMSRGPGLLQMGSSKLGDFVEQLAKMHFDEAKFQVVVLHSPLLSNEVPRCLRLTQGIKKGVNPRMPASLVGTREKYIFITTEMPLEDTFIRGCGLGIRIVTDVNIEQYDELRYM